MRIILYLFSIVLANVITAAFQPLQLGVLIIPMGSFLIGVTFIFRDIVQNKYGKKKTYMLIGLALILSAAVSYMLGDTLAIVFASAASFLIAESADTEIYSRLKLSMSMRVLISGLFGGLLDSVIFVVLGMSPLGANFIPWEAVPFAILGQLLSKSLMQATGAFVLHEAMKLPKVKHVIEAR